jgi:hypothetical protein
MRTARNATLEDLAAILQAQKAEQLDIVAPAATARSKAGVLHVEGIGYPTITESGVTPGIGKFRPTAVFDEGLAEKLQIPVAYLRRMREQRPDLYDLNINGLLHGKSVRKAGGGVEVIHPADDRKFLLRLFRGDEGGEGVARAMLSDSYKTIDNLDILTAILSVVQASHMQVEIEKADLTDRRMYLDMIAPQMAALAPVLLGGYRNPFEDPRIEGRRRGAGLWVPRTRSRQATGLPRPTKRRGRLLVPAPPQAVTAAVGLGTGHEPAVAAATPPPQRAAELPAAAYLISR